MVYNMLGGICADDKIQEKKKKKTTEGERKSSKKAYHSWDSDHRRHRHEGDPPTKPK